MLAQCCASGKDVLSTLQKQLYLLRTDHDTVAHYITRQFSFQRNSILLRRYNALICGVITPYFKALLRLIRALLRLKLNK